MAINLLASCSSTRNAIRFQSELAPVGDDAGKIGFLVMIHPVVTLSDESLLLSKCSDHTGAQQGFIEVCVDWRATHWLQTLQLPWGRHVKTLREKHEQRQDHWKEISSTRALAIEQLQEQSPEAFWVSTRVSLKGTILTTHVSYGVQACNMLRSKSYTTEPYIIP